MNYFKADLGVQGEAVVDASWQNDHVSLDNFNPYPLVVLVTHVKVATPIDDEANLLIGMNVLFEEILDLTKKRMYRLHTEVQVSMIFTQRGP